jgi:hypothetical protein
MNFFYILSCAQWCARSEFFCGSLHRALFRFGRRTPLSVRGVDPTTGPFPGCDFPRAGWRSASLLSFSAGDFCFSSLLPPGFRPPTFLPFRSPSVLSAQSDFAAADSVPARAHGQVSFSVSRLWFFCVNSRCSVRAGRPPFCVRITGLGPDSSSHESSQVAGSLFPLFSCHGVAAGDFFFHHRFWGIVSRGAECLLLPRIFFVHLRSYLICPNSSSYFLLLSAISMICSLEIHRRGAAIPLSS